jgi:Cap4 SAVED domain
LRVDLHALLEVDRKDYSSLFSTVEHDIACGEIPSASIRLHFIRHDAGGLVAMSKVVETLISYITHFCFTSERRANLGEQARNRAFMEAKRLFRKSPTSGQPGELLVYFLIEAVLQAPQVLKKMLITTNPNDERKGSDGVHVRWGSDKDLLEVIFAEAKLHKSFAAALTSAFTSMNDFHNSKTKNLEINYFLNAFSLLSPEQQKVIASYVEGENKAKCQEVHACLIGYSWKEYECLKDEKKKAFLEEFESRYLTWVSSEMRPKLNAELASFPHSHLNFEFFFLPLASVDNFRSLFLESL